MRLGAIFAADRFGRRREIPEASGDRHQPRGAFHRLEKGSVDKCTEPDPLDTRAFSSFAAVR